MYYRNAMIETTARHIGYLCICFFNHVTWFFCLIFSKPSFYLTVSNLEQMLQMSCLEFMHKLSWSFTNLWRGSKLCHGDVCLQIFAKFLLLYYQDECYIYYLSIIILKESFHRHCVKSVRIWSYSGPHFATFWLNRERYRNVGKCGPV